jgi:3-isopropylmalate dehydrogenase
MAQFTIEVLPGDGIGAEVMAEALKLLRAVTTRFGHTFALKEDLVGGACIDKHGTAVRDETLADAKRSHAVLFGAVGGPKWDDPKAPMQRRPEWGLLQLRKQLGLFANLRPVRVHPLMVDASTIKRDVLEGTDLIVIRELTGGLYFGKPQRRWIKANILDTSRMWREIAMEMSAEYPDVTLEHLLVDACTMHLIRRPADFDVIVTENTFGDILTDEASMLAGSMGVLPSASLGRRRADGTGLGMYEPIHGTAPDIAGQGKANPIAMILSTAMLLRLSLGLTAEAEAVEAAVDGALSAGYRTPDIAVEGSKLVSTGAMGDEIAGRIT